MNFSFEKPALRKQRFPLNAKIVLPITVVLAIILIISAVLDYWGSRRELSHILQEQSQALITALEKGSQNAIASYDLVQDLVAQRLLDNARLLEQMDFSGLLDERLLQKVADENDIFRINVFDAHGEKIMASFEGMGWGANRPASDNLLQAIEQQNSDELVMGFRSSRFGQGQRFAIAKKRRNGGVIVLNINSEEMLEFRRSIGLGKLIRDIGENEGVEYIALQDTAQIIIATEGMDSLSSVQADAHVFSTLLSGVASTRFITYKGKQIFEIVHLFDAANGEIIRIGLGTAHLQEAQNSALTRAALSSLLLLIFGVIGASWIFSSQNVRSLKDAYARIETYTGSMLENKTDSIIAVNGHGNITLVNEAAEKLFSMSGKNVLGKPCAEEIVAVCPYLKQGLETGERKFYHEVQLDSGIQVLTADVSINVIQDEHGQPDIVFAVIRNVTEMKRLQENLKRKDQITAMGHLASGVAHEIRNPLNAIGMIGQRLKAEFRPVEDAPEYAQLTSTIVSETRRINDIIQQFLHFARPAELVKTEIQIANVFNDISAMLTPQAAARGIRVFAECETMPVIHADANKIKQVLLNLGQNAIDACSSGDEIRISCRLGNQLLTIQVSDTGKGMSTEELKKIFNLYFSTKEHGTGIGLSVVQQIISQHDGAIDVQSEPDKGTTVTITLPLD